VLGPLLLVGEQLALEQRVLLGRAPARARAGMPSGAVRISSSSAAQPSIVPMKVLPTPSKPAATAPCRFSGAE
jgi:hypothetical protein